VSYHYCTTQHPALTYGPEAIQHKVILDPIEHHVADLLRETVAKSLPPSRAPFAALQQRRDVLDAHDAVEVADKGGGVYL
jgi:hypothetical protein